MWCSFKILWAWTVIWVVKDEDFSGTVQYRFTDVIQLSFLNDGRALDNLSSGYIPGYNPLLKEGVCIKIVGAKVARLFSK